MRQPYRIMIGFLTFTLVTGCITATAQAQVPAPFTCEQRNTILLQLVDDLSARRRDIEIDMAAFRVQIKELIDQQKEAKKATEKTPAEKKTK